LTASAVVRIHGDGKTHCEWTTPEKKRNPKISEYYCLTSIDAGYHHGDSQLHSQQGGLRSDLER